MAKELQASLELSLLQERIYVVCFIISGYVLNFLKSKKTLKIIGFLIILLSLVGIILTGERSNSLKALIGFLIFISIIDYVKLKIKY